MALTKKPTAQKSEPEATAKVASAPADETRNSDQPVPEVDEQGNPINAGDANAKPAENSEPVSQDAAENKPEEEEKPELPVNPNPQGPVSTEAPEKSPEVLQQEAADEAKKADELAAERARAKTTDTLVSVKNISSQPQRQWSTGIWIAPGATEKVKNDGWYRANKLARVLEDASASKKKD